MEVPLYTNPLTLRISEILIKDMIKISKYPYPFGFRELDKLRRNARFLNNGTREDLGTNFHLTFFDAGHIPGSVSIMVEVDGTRILYTGDLNTQETNLINAANSSDFPEIDVLITESTYALREHPNRKELERELYENVRNVIDNGGNVLIPAFGVARSQEILLVLEKYDIDFPLYLDGLTRKISLNYSEFPNAFKDYQRFRKAMKKAQFVSKKTRKMIKDRSGGVIIAPSGMLKGGAALEYIHMILEDPFSALYLVGYQVEGTPGRKLLDEGMFEFHENSKRYKNFGGEVIKARCDLNYYDFSSHADGSHLHDYIDALKFRNGDKTVFCVHGDEKSATTLAKDLVNKGFNSVAPETGEIYKI